MRLIHTKSGRLDEFFGDETPAYAILSHRWRKEEVTIQEWVELADTTKAKGGFRKISRACQIASQMDLD
ncbi:hypothetical protein B0H63DRAFT_487203 [Podospora didyma]|uniref:Uncharacterized protein n=1 Tax=Podospora didyma TaxID=330526 RepID=A0AAE0N519_9PEZI|nr:hypothetical protein B0H63DRAFT_487203 [Podospora didyma]